MSQEKENIPPVEVPADNLSPETLASVIESYVLRDGTDYGAVEVSLPTKIDQIRRQIAKGDVKVVFDPNTETVTLMTRKQFAEASVQTSSRKGESPTA